MRRYLIAASAALSLVLLTGPALSQEKTASACIKEWRAAKADFQKKGITEKAYVEQCRGGSNTAKAAAPETSKKSARVSRDTERNATPASGTKTAKACRDEWRADKANFQAKGVTEKSYIADCRGNATTAAAEPAKPASSNDKSSRWSDIFRPRETSGARPTTSANTQGQYAGEAEARARCGSDTVVWANLDSKIYHFAGKKAYGHTKKGAFMCEREAMGQGMRASKSEERPGS